jgi:hypothetical protein
MDPDDTLPCLTTTIPAPPPEFDAPPDAERLFGRVDVREAPSWDGFASDHLDE